MDVNPTEDDPRSRWQAWIPVIQAAINGAAAVIVTLIGQGRHPF
jgi:hypothetical protein